MGLNLGQEEWTLSRKGHCSCLEPPSRLLTCAVRLPVVCFFCFFSPLLSCINNETEPCKNICFDVFGLQKKWCEGQRRNAKTTQHELESH